MKKLLILFLATIIITLILIVGVVIFLSINGADLEVKLGLAARRDLDTESQLQGAPGRVAPGALDVYTPIPQQVYFENKVMVEGKAKSQFVIVFVNKNHEILLKTDPEGRFKSEIELQPGANQIFVFAPATEDGDLSKEIIIGYYPELKDNTNTKFAFVGEIMSSSPQSLEIAFGKDRFVLGMQGSTKIFKSETQTSVDKLEITERAGVIAIQEPDGKFKAVMIKTDLFPYYFHGFLDQNSGSGGVIERKRVGGAKANVSLSGNTESFTIRDQESLINSQFKDIPLRAKVLVNGYILPKESKSNYTLNSAIVIP